MTISESTMHDGLFYVNITESSFLDTSSSSDLNPIFKIMPLENVLKSLDYPYYSDPYLWFANPTTWKDPFESRFINATYGKFGQFPLKDRCWATCITPERTVEAQWNMYSDNQLGVQIVFNKKTLLGCICKFADQNNMDVYIGKVQYESQEDIKSSVTSPTFNKLIGTPFCLSNRDSLIRTFFLKRNAYRYENEIRILLVLRDGAKFSADDSNMGIKVPVNKATFNRLVLSPNTEEKASTLLKGAISSFRVEQSRLYDPESKNHHYKYPSLKTKNTNIRSNK